MDLSSLGILNYFAGKFEGVMHWAGRRGWHLVQVGEVSYQSVDTPGARGLLCRGLFEVSAWAMRKCMK